MSLMSLMSLLPRVSRIALVVGGWSAAAGTASAADAWTHVRSPHFTVASNAGESRARSVAWQFEQIRGAIEKGWPWARVDLDRPVHVIAVKDEATMKAMAPALFEKRSDSVWSSVLTTAPDRHYILLRADLVEEDRDGQNPYLAAYRSYSSLTLHASFGRSLPLWLVEGLAGLLSNSIVRKNEIHFGRPLPGYVSEIQTGTRFRLTELLAITAQSPALANTFTRIRYDANAWGLVQYLLFGHPEGQPRFQQLMTAIAQGTSAADALAKAYGPLDRLEEASLGYLQNRIFSYGRLPVTSDVTKQKYPTRVLAVAELAAERAGFHVTMARPKEARALLDEAVAADAELPHSYEVEGLSLDRDREPDEAQRAFEKAVERRSENFYVHFRLANLRARQPLDAAGADAAIALLERAAALNDRFAPTLAFLSFLYDSRRRFGPALEYAQKALAADPNDARYGLRLAQALARSSRADEAKRTAQTALARAVDEDDRRDLQSLLDSLNRPASSDANQPVPIGTAGAGRETLDPDRSSSSNDAVPVTTPNGPDEPVPSPVGDNSGRTRALRPTRSNDQTPPPSPPPGTAGTLDAPPTLRKRVEPSFPADATRGVDQGTVVVEIRIGPDGRVVDAKIQGAASKFDAAALDAVRQWEYEPTIVNGQPVGVIMAVPLNFGF